MEKVFVFRPLQEKDLTLLFEWLGLPHVAEWWRESRDWEILKAKYLKKIHADDVFSYLACINKTPIGFIQGYKANEWATQHSSQPYGVDLFIADTNYLGKGYGQKMIKEFINEILMPLQPTSIIVDPEITNTKAIQFYEKVGFKQIKEITTFDGQKPVPGILMELEIKGLL